MPFEKVETTVDFPAVERSILQLWDELQAFEKLRAKNRGKPKWSFLDGPITANNPMGVHHAWGRTYKDAYQRYFAMTGHELRYQNGFDCQGLWVEVEVEKELRLKSKRDIENLVAGDKFKSIDFFVNECKERVNKFARRQTEQSIRLGQWMDWDRTDADWAKPPGERKSYFTMADENNYTIWSFLKKCHDRKLVYKSYDSMPWCGRCGTGISQQEMNEGYQLVAHRSVFVKFPLRLPSPPVLGGRGAGGEGGEPRGNLLIWTTTPWTLSSNVGAAVNPTLTYLKVKHKDEFYYVAKGAFTAHRLEEQFKRKEWLEGVPKLKTLEQIFKEKGGYEIVGEIPGKDMVGWQYDGPFDELPAQQHPYGYPEQIATVVERLKWGPAKSAMDVHRVVAWDVVGETEGTGIVHIAPGCGKEDFGLGKEQGLVPIAPLDDSGVFLEGFGELTGKSANDPALTDWILDNLTKKNRLLAVEKYPHSYPHCWRCKTELLFRLVDEWFIDMGKKPSVVEVEPIPNSGVTELEEIWAGEDWNENVPESERIGEEYEYTFRTEIRKVVENVTFLPESINGRSREVDWLRTMGDWMISKKRFWGLALPIWVDEETDDFEVIGSYDDLKKRALDGGEGWEQFEGHSPHRPWIDLIKIKNPKSGNLMSRIPDVGNPWLDAGIVPYSTMKYNTDRDYWKQWFPAAFITEAFPGQFRNWFYAILTMSTMMEQQAPMKVLLGHGMVRDDHGEEMHKTKGNAIAFEGAADEGYELKEKDGKAHKHPPMGSDLMRWMYCRNNPAANINFGPHLAEEVRSKFIMKLWNTYAFFSNYARLDEFDPSAPQVPVKDRPDIDRWILSDLQLLIQVAHDAFQSYNVMAFCLKAEEFVDDKLSNWYVRRNRRRFWKADKGADKQAAYQTLYTVLTTMVKLCAPVIPFMTEKMHQNLSEPEALARAASVHLCEYPIADESLLDHELSDEMDALLRLVSLGGSARNAVKIKVRQPLAEIKIQPQSDAERKAVERFADQIRDELNIKLVALHSPELGPLLSFDVKLNPKAAGPKFGPKLAAVTAALAKCVAEQDRRVGISVADFLQAGKILALQLSDGATVNVELADVWITPRVEKGWGGIADRGTQILLDGRITPELELEGLAREIVRHVQNARKDAGLEMDDRICLYLQTDDAKLQEAIRTHRDYIAAETLVVKWATEPLGGLSHRVEVKIEGMKLVIELKKAEH